MKVTKERSPGSGMTRSGLAAGLEATLAYLLSLTDACHDDWWIIGSAAMALHGAKTVSVADVDVITSPRDALMLLESHGTPVSKDEGKDRFRSQIFGRLTGAQLPVEVMAGLEVRQDREWVEVAPATRVALPVASRTAYAPDLEELIEITRLFGRPKDFERLAALESLR